MEKFLRRAFYKKCTGNGKPTFERVAELGSALKNSIVSAFGKLRPGKVRNEGISKAELRFYSDG
jgi:propanediol dehydratase small subunit